MIKILAWNIRQGGGSRIQSIIDGIKSIDPDIISFSEFRNNKHGIRLRTKFLELGYPYQFVTAASSNENAVCVFSRFPANSKLYSANKYAFNANILTTSFDAFNFSAVYLPHKKKHKLFDILLAESKENKPYIIMGDYNTGKNFIDQKGDSFWYTKELKKLELTGMVDAFRLIHGDAREFSWFSHQGNGYRYDHCYISETLKPITKSCYYLHELREQGLSDHSPMVLSLG